MKAEQTECLRVYLRYQNAEDRDLQRRLNADRQQGRAVSATVRDALRAYYYPPTPNPAPEVQALAHELSALSELVYALTHEVHALRALVSELDAVRAQNAHLQTLLVSATFGDKTMRHAATQAAHALAVGDGNGNGNGRA